MVIAFGLAAALLSAGAAVGLLFAAQRARAGGPAADPTVDTHRRLLGEIDALARRGLLADTEREAARAEAGRRLLRAAETPDGTGGRAPPWAAPALCVAGPVLAAGIYLAVGAPGAPDQGYARRLSEWRASPESLGPDQAAAVLGRIVRERPNDPEAFGQLARARAAAGDGFGAVRAAEAAARLEPGRAERWTTLGEALLGLETPAVDEARTVLRRALQLSPGDPDARYWLGRAAFAEGDRVGGQAVWRTLEADLAPDDPRRAALHSELAAVDAPTASEVDAAISNMVAGLAARLRAEPLDPQGWARLVRAYGVLGRDAEQAAALAEARRLFSGRPEVIAELETAAAEGRSRGRSTTGALRGGR
ncbi:MAG: c-type cytochrome biogenesis protein CcmI [Proteobacteria bacterium]|nr:c-type cytochrome biogenesis protein CcmI [Pseudomonadota bacterium]